MNDLITNPYVSIGAGAILFIMSELIAASKLKANSVTGLIISILKLIVPSKK